MEILSPDSLTNVLITSHSVCIKVSLSPAVLVFFLSGFSPYVLMSFNTILLPEYLLLLTITEGRTKVALSLLWDVILSLH